MSEPAGFQRWLKALQAHGAGKSFAEDLARRLRVLASLKDNSVFLVSGTGALPYIPWLRDGMPMNGRLIVHLEPGHDALDTLLKSQLHDDIRVAAHSQELPLFCADIARHKLDFVLLDAGTNLAIVLPLIREMLGDHALLIVLLKQGEQIHRVAKISADFFMAPLDESQTAWMLARKGRQHRTARRSSHLRRRSSRRR